MTRSRIPSPAGSFVVMNASTLHTPEPAIVLADGCLSTLEGKVAHGLVRGSDRFSVRAVVDRTLARCDAGVVVSGTPSGIPVVATVADALRHAPEARVAVVGHAPHGGRVTAELRSLLMQCAWAGLNLVSGLHDFLSEDAELAKLVAAHGATITDVRRTPPGRELRFWDGSVHSVRATRIAVLGTDCAIGKRTTSRMLTAELNDRGVRTEMIYTGQTGWMQGGRYGIILDSLIEDFVAGELEGAIVACAEDADPDVMILEGQSALRNPAGPCGATLMLSGAAAGVVLQHAPARTHYDGFDGLHQARIAGLASEIDLIGHYGVPVLAVALNLTGVDAQDVDRVVADCRAQSRGIPVIDVVTDGIGALADVVSNHPVVSNSPAVSNPAVRQAA